MGRTVVVVGLCMASAWGCASDVSEQPSGSARTDVVLKVVVVEPSDRLATSIARLRGDWAELSDGDLVVEEASSEQLLMGDSLTADLVIYPARYLGQLVADTKVRPLRQSVLEDEEVAFAEILPLVRERELAFDGQYYALSFGSRVLAMRGREQTVHGGDGSPRIDTPESPADRQENAPEAPYAAAWQLLATAAPYARHPNQIATLFDPETMAPWIDGPPYVFALQELVSGRLAAADPHQEDFSRWTWWPRGLPDGQSLATTGRREIHFPTANKVYDFESQRWETPDKGESRVPLIGSTGWIGSVTSSSRNPPAAFRLLAWLAARSANGQGRVSIAPYRRGMSDSVLEWAYSATNYLQVPRIHRVDDYLAVLDQYVAKTQRGEVSPQDALAETALQWERITDQIGRQRQQSLYRRHLNIE